MCFKTKSTTKGKQEATTKSNLYDDEGLQNFLAGYNQQFSGDNISQVSAPVNQYQTGAADAQSGVVAGMTPAFDAAGQLATSGLDPNRVQDWMNPFEDNVVAALKRDYADENARELALIRSRAARSGALGNSTNAVSERLATDSARERLDSQLANVRQAGWTQAANLTAQDAQTQLAGAGQLGALSGIATGANQAQGQLGQNIWQANLANQVLPYQLYQQGVQGYTGLGNLSGQHSYGTHSSTTTSSPSIGSIIAGGLGTALSAFGGGGGFNPFGSLFGGGSKMADGGAVVKREHGGSVMTPFHGSGSSFADKVRDAHKAVTEMRNGGGRVEKDAPRQAFAGGGTPDPWADPFAADLSVPDMGATPDGGLLGWRRGTRAVPITPYRGNDAVEQPRDIMLPSLEAREQPATLAFGPPVGGEAMRPFGVEMAEFERPVTFDNIGAQPYRVDASEFTDAPNPYAGSVPSVRGVKPAYALDPGEVAIGRERGTTSVDPNKGSWAPFSRGIWAGERPVGLQGLGLALTQIGNGPFAGFGQAMMQQLQLANQDRQADLAARRLQHEMDRQRLELDERTRHNRATEAHATATLEQGNWLPRPDGSLINKRTGEVRGAAMPSDMDRRAADAERAGLKPGDPGYQQFVLTGRMGSTELSPAQAQRLHTAREAERTAEGTLRDLDRALEINNRTYSGWGAEGRADIVQNIPLLGGTTAARETQELARIMTGQMLGRLRSIFGGNPTEGERRILAEVEGSANLSPGVREDILKRAQELVRANLRGNQETIAAIEGRRFGRPDADAPARDETRRDPNRIPDRPQAVPAGAQWNPARRQWRDPAGKIYDEQGNPVNG